MVHEGLKNFICSILGCDAAYATKQQLERHHKKCHEDPAGPHETLYCHFCTKTFISIYGLNKHVETKHANEHLEEFGGEKFECQTCGKNFKILQHLELHTKWHESAKGAAPKARPGAGPRGNGDLSCHACGKTYSSIQNLKLHVRSVHEGRKDWECTEEIEVDDETFETGEVIDEKTGQVLVEAKAIPKIFVKCGKQFTTKQQLQKHNRVVHECIKDQVFCEICGKKYATKYVLKGHMETKHDVVEYDVDEDGYTGKGMGQKWDNVRNMQKIMKILDDGKAEEVVEVENSGNMKEPSRGF